MNVGQALQDRVGHIAQEAGELLLSFFNKQLHVTHKPHAGLVTEADVASENYIVERLRLIDPSIGVWAEERGKSGTINEWCWVIDPLDGTTNFVNHIPYFCISIALTRHNVTQLGVIYNPLTKELFTVRMGAGAQRNGMLITVNHAALEQGVIAISFPYTDDQIQTINHNIETVLPLAFDMRRMGAAALDLALVASGSFAATFFHQLSWWDIAAGMLLITEAGGTVMEFDGTPVGPNYQTFLAGNTDAVKQLRTLLSK